MSEDELSRIVGGPLPRRESARSTAAPPRRVRGVSIVRSIQAPARRVRAVAEERGIRFVNAPLRRARDGPDAVRVGWVDETARAARSVARVMVTSAEPRALRDGRLICRRWAASSGPARRLGATRGRPTRSETSWSRRSTPISNTPGSTCGRVSGPSRGGPQCISSITRGVEVASDGWPPLCTLLRDARSYKEGDAALVRRRSGTSRLSRLAPSPRAPSRRIVLGATLRQALPAAFCGFGSMLRSFTPAASAIARAVGEGTAPPRDRG